ncbi:MAG: methionine adenosyltransferase [archaeon]
MNRYLFTSESVGPGHPDKVCDQISDVLLDAFLAGDPESRVAAECLVKNNTIFIAGEITSKHRIDIEKIIRKKIIEIGYDSDELGFNGHTCQIVELLSQQSPDIARGVNKTSDHEQGAGDQGMMFGFATNETPEYMPAAIILSHKLLIKLGEVRKSGSIEGLRPDAKCQVSVEYENDKPVRIHTVVVSTQHAPFVVQEELKKEIIEKVILPVCSGLVDKGTTYHVNPTGRFVVGGPVGDSGLTGRKIIVDTYGGFGRHGGGAFSGKDPSKVDRSAAYMARYVAKNIVAAGLADRCEIQIAYAIGIAEPVSLYVNCFGTNKISEERIVSAVRKNFLLQPGQIIRHLNLKRPIYEKTACYGHFGRDDSDFSWEKLDKVNELKKEL